VLASEQVESGTSVLDLTIATPGPRPDGENVLILVHGLPRAYGMGRLATGLLPELSEHLAADSGWVVASATLSGVGASTGTFSAAQWRADLSVVIDRMAASNGRISLAGFGLGGALALAVAAGDERVRGLALFATPADLPRWCGDPEELRRIIVAAEVFDTSVHLLPAAALVEDIVALDPLVASAKIPPRRLLIAHGSDDREVPVSEARQLLASADGRGELRVIQGAGHWLRADPRMVATLLGWLDRH
jgi:putative redox protein